LFNIAKSGLLVLCIYATGLILYAGLFEFIPIVPAWVQVGKMAVASIYFLVLLIPLFMAQSRWLALRVLGYAVLIASFLYVFFLTSYYAYFGFVPEIYALGAANAPDMMGVLGHYFRQIFGASEVLLLIAAALFFFLLPRQKLHLRASVLLVLPVALFAVNFMTYGTPQDTKRWGNGTVIKRFGLPTFYYLSARDWLSYSSGYIAAETAFPGKLTQVAYGTPPEAGPSPFALRRPVDRVVMVQIESFDREAIDAELNGVTVMPFTSALKADTCLEYTNYYTVKSVGGSADSEYSVATGRLPSSKLQAIRSTDFSTIETIYDVLAANGITSSFAHNNTIGFYGRNYAYAQLENVDAQFVEPNTENNERQFALETLSDAMTGSERSFYYFFNVQSHGPFRGYSAETGDTFGLETGSQIKEDYMATMHEVDQTIAEMFALQQAEFDAGNSLFILTADHPSYLHTGDDPLQEAHIPMLLCHADFSGQKIDKLASTVDVFPTVLDAFGVAIPETTISSSLLAEGPSVVLFPSGQVLYRDSTDAVVSRECDAGCAPFFDYTNQSISVSN
jgi:phosphoglycerol transferase MdoB-like AlkP superfamily enzyme